MYTDIPSYNNAQTTSDKAICELLCKEIFAALPEAESKIWHGHPVWFLAGNPVVGYAKLKHSVQLLFWSGQSFDEKGLTAEGSFKAAEARYTEVSQINLQDLRRWLKKSNEIQWNYKDIVKNRGKLELIK